LIGALVERRAQPGDRVLLVPPTGAEMVIAFTSVMWSGAVAVPIFASFSVADLGSLCTHCSPRPSSRRVSTSTLLTGPYAPPSLQAAVVGVPVPRSSWLSREEICERHSLNAPVPREDDDPAHLPYERHIKRGSRRAL
jgi:acyl-coenzyme A synthetase/AMP-(fatty) acid ligase